MGQKQVQKPKSKPRKPAADIDKRSPSGKEHNN